MLQNINMSDRYTTMPSFNFEDSTDDDSGISSTSGPNSIKLDSEAQSVVSWDSESQRSWENDEEDEDEDDALGTKINISRIKRCCIKFASKYQC